MSSRFSFVFLCAAAVTLAACHASPLKTSPDGSSGAPQEIPGWHVKKGFLRDVEGRAAILRGVNFATGHKASPYYGLEQESDYQHVPTWGMNAVRYLVTWAAIEPQKGQYDDAFLDQVAERMQWAADAGLSVVIDMHQDVYGEGFGFDGAARWTCAASYYAAFKPPAMWFLSSLDPNVEACEDNFYADAELRAHFIEAWRRLAARLAASPAVIGFDALNEPFWGTFPVGQVDAVRLEPLYEALVPVVRSAAPDWIAFLEPSAARNLGISTSLTPFPFADVVYAPHSYDNAAESGAGFDPTHVPELIANIGRLSSEAQSLDAALWIGEYGGVGTESGIEDYMDAQYAGAGAVAGSTMYWAYGPDDSYGFVAADGTDKPVFLDTLVRPYPRRVAGDPISYTHDRTTGLFQLVYTPDPTVTAPTEIVVPDLRYPNGYEVDCGGCTYEKSPALLTITTPPTTSPATISIHP